MKENKNRGLAESVLGEPLARTELKLRVDALQRLIANMTSEVVELNHLGQVQDSVLTEPDFYDVVERFQAMLIADALGRAGGSQRRAARLLGLSPTTLNSMIKRLRVQVPPADVRAAAETISKKRDNYVF